MHVSVHWLSLEQCVTRILRLYEPLLSYFKSASMLSNINYLFWSFTSCRFSNFCLKDESEPRFRRLQEAFSNSMTELYLLFFQASLPVFTTFNLLFQREEASIFLLHDEV